LLQSRRIKKVSYKRTLPEWGRLVVGGDGFTVELPVAFSQPDMWERLRLAHEVSHTLFYNIEQWPPVPLVYLEPGNPDLEWLCGYLAKCLLLPSEWMRREAESLSSMGSEAFSLSVLSRLEKVFVVPWQVVAERLVEQLGFWKCVLLQFVMCCEAGETGDKRERVWRMDWHTIPAEVGEELFIPVGRRIAGIMKFPRAKGALERFIEECSDHADQEYFFARIIGVGVLNSSTTGNLGKFLLQRLGTDRVRVYGWASRRVESGTFDWASAQKEVSRVLLCFPVQEVRSATSPST
jgi:hypothetical protein